MTTLAKTYDFASDGGGFSFVSGGKATGAWQSTGGNPSGCWGINSLGRNNADTSYIELVTTWESLGVPSGATINEISNSAFDWSCITANISDGYTVGELAIYDNSLVLQATLIASQAGSGTTGFATRSNASAVSIPTAIQSSSTTIRIRLFITLDNGNNASAETAINYDNVAFTIDYTAGGSTIPATTSESESSSENQNAVLSAVGVSSDSESSTTIELAVVNAVGSSIETEVISDNQNAGLIAVSTNTESANIEETQDSIISIAGSVSDNENINDSQSADIGIAALSIDAEAIAEEQTAIQTANVGVVEAATIQTNSDANNTTSSNLDEDESISEVQDAIVLQVISGVITEVLVADDAFTNVLSATSSNNEESTLNEQQTSIAIKSDSIAEYQEVIEAQDAIITSDIVSVINEEESINDNINATTISNLVVAESAEVTDIPDGIVIFVTTIQEGSSVVETIGAVRKLQVDAQEVVTIAETLGSGSVLLTSMNETITISELYDFLSTIVIDIARIAGTAPMSQISGRLDEDEVTGVIRQITIKGK